MNSKKQTDVVRYFYYSWLEKRRKIKINVFTNKLMLQRALPIHHKLNRIMLEVLFKDLN